MPIKIREDGTRVLVIKGTGPEPSPPPYHMNKPGVPPGQVPDEVKEQMRQAREDRRRPAKRLRQKLEDYVTQEIGLFEAIHSQRAIRRFKPDAVPDDMVRRLIEAGTKAPSGGNRQGWKFIAVTDQALKDKIGEYYELGWEYAYGARNPAPSELQPHVRRSAEHLARTMARVPLLLVACVEHDGGASTMGRGGSIFPSVQNILLAAMGMGLGSCLTSLHKRYEDEIKALLGIPENVETAAILPVGFPADGARYGPTRRAPVEEVAYRERWGEAWE